MIEVGLTGGIGCGKSTVSGMMRALGALVIDADELAREAVSPGGGAYRPVVRAFGDEVLGPDGAIDRSKLADMVFADTGKRALLESIVHPEVFALERRIIERFAAERPDCVAVFDAALLIESGAHVRMDKVIVVWCSPETQMLRLTAGKGLTREDAERRMAAQMPLDEKLTYADFVIDNDGPISDTKKRVEEVFGKLLQYV